MKPRCYEKSLRLIGLVLLVGLSDSFAAEPVTMDDLVQVLNVPQDQVNKLEKGEIISYSVAEQSDKELATGVATLVAAPVANVIAKLKKADVAAIDPDILAQGDIPTTAGPDAFKGFAFKAKGEAGDFLKAEPGDRFNLSAEEIAQLKAARQKLGDVGGKALIDAASREYREILFKRWQAYRKSGLSGIAPYLRDGRAADPAAELRLATTSSRVLAKYFPQFQQGLLKSPADVPAGTEEKFRWLVRKVEDRPTATLVHRLWKNLDRGAVIVSREYYAGHSYNSSQLTIGILPCGDKTAVIYTDRSFTDQVAGMGSGLKHSIGRERLKDAMTKRLQRLKALVGGAR